MTSRFPPPRRTTTFAGAIIAVAMFPLISLMAPLFSVMGNLGLLRGRRRNPILSLTV